jgi:multimeric flavodoxin WrbA
MKKNILILSSSPRVGGNSQTLCHALADGARSTGNDVTILDVSRLYISPCRGCEYCYHHDRECCQHDDMDQVWEYLNQADVLVLASPVYFYNFSAQLKLVIDRLYARNSCLHPRECALLLTCAGGRGAAKAPRICYQQIAESLKLHDRGIITASDVWEEGDIQEHSALQEAYQLGASL